MDPKVSAHKGLHAQHAAACQAFGTPKTSQKLLDFEGLHPVWTCDVSNKPKKNRRSPPNFRRDIAPTVFCGCKASHLSMIHWKGLKPPVCEKPSAAVQKMPWPTRFLLRISSSSGNSGNSGVSWCIPTPMLWQQVPFKRNFHHAWIPAQHKIAKAQGMSGKFWSTEQQADQSLLILFCVVTPSADLTRVH